MVERVNGRVGTNYSILGCGSRNVLDLDQPLDIQRSTQYLHHVFSLAARAVPHLVPA